ncbi:hypothetical protein, partial [Echinicola rosea]|uniref:hypothetical protein n=1 Tax=Echinicola rosea TaxID=1807691 RepID=UPI001E55AA46
PIRHQLDSMSGFPNFRTHKVTKKPRRYATAHRCAAIGLKLKPPLMQANSSCLKPGKPFLAANILFG